jgi:hypothetical protein
MSKARFGFCRFLDRSAQTELRPTNRFRQISQRRDPGGADALSAPRQAGLLSRETPEIRFRGSSLTAMQIQLGCCKTVFGSSFAVNISTNNRAALYSLSRVWPDDYSSYGPSLVRRSLSVANIKHIRVAVRKVRKPADIESRPSTNGKS